MQGQCSLLVSNIEPRCLQIEPNLQVPSEYIWMCTAPPGVCDVRSPGLCTLPDPEGIREHAWRMLLCTQQLCVWGTPWPSSLTFALIGLLEVTCTLLLLTHDYYLNRRKKIEQEGRTQFLFLFNILARLF